MKVRLDWKGDFGSPEKQGYDGDEGRSRGDAKVAAPLAAFLHNPLAVQELRANKKELRVEKLKDKEEVEDLTQEMAELWYRTLIPRPQASSLQLKNGSLVDGWKWSRPNGGHAGLT
ncbi:uncharacterized protein DS421_10g298230 [Arachis hypogaea]|nr:uncharacterized protein DS421_10g298230 [Arachis hypogaea]